MPSLETAQARGEAEPIARRAGGAASKPGFESPRERGAEPSRGQRKVTCDSESTGEWGARASRPGLGGASIDNIETS